MMPSEEGMASGALFMGIWKIYSLIMSCILRWRSLLLCAITADGRQAGIGTGTEQIGCERGSATHQYACSTASSISSPLNRW